METATAHNKPTAIVALNENELRGEKVYCTVLFRFGFINAHVSSLTTSKEEKINQAVPFLFAEYVSDTLMRQAISGKCFVQANSITLHFSSPHSSILPKLEDLFRTLFSEASTEEEFEAFKKRAYEKFSKRYADTRYRAYLKILEVCGYEAQFRLEDLIKSLQEIAFEEYSSFLRRMLHPGNLVMFLDGKTKGLSQDAVINSLPPTFAERGDKDWGVVSIPSTATALESDYSSELLGDREMYAFALKFYFGKADSNDIFVFLLFVSAALDVPTVMLLDGNMPSIICLIEEEKEIDATLLKNLDEERFEQLKLSCEMFLSSAYQDPQNFGGMVVRALSQGVDIFAICTGFASVSFEDVTGFVEDKYPHIRKGLVRVEMIGEDDG